MIGGFLTTPTFFCMNVSKEVSRSKSELHLLEIEAAGLQMFKTLDFSEV